MSIRHTGQIQPQLDLEEHQGDIDAKRVVLIDKDTGNPYDVGDINFAIQVDEASGSITYVGKAPIGTATSSASWQIMKIDESGDPELIITWADGNDSFDNIWDNRASLNYS